MEIVDADHPTGLFDLATFCDICMEAPLQLWMVPAPANTGQ